MNKDQHALLEILARNIQLAPEALDSDDDLADLGIDSLKFIVIMLEIEQALKRQVFAIDTVGQLRTVGNLLALVADPPDPPGMPFHPRGSGLLH